jgi:3-hydroxy acid dehydrogenase/malonic semialdehyde reductase
MATTKERLSGKTILITGASSGIGASTAIEFAQTSPENLRLVLAARRVDRLTELSANLKASFPGVKVHIAQLDVSKPDEIKKFVGQLPAEFQDIDVLVNNAYVSQAFV